MSDGKQHLNYWNKGKIIIFPFSFSFSILIYSLTASIIMTLIMGISMIAGYMLGYFVDPDLDLIGISSQESRMMNKLGIVGVFITMWFLPYAYFMRFIGIGKKGHRNFFSHTPFIGTLIRIIWLFGIPFFIYWWNFIVEIEVYSALIGIWLGLSIADTIHFIADVLSSEHKKRKYLDR